MRAVVTPGGSRTARGGVTIVTRRVYHGHEPKGIQVVWRIRSIYFARRSRQWYLQTCYTTGLLIHGSDEVRRITAMIERVLCHDSR